MKYPKVSIIIPTYNEEKNIGKCLDSLLNQDYPKDKYEIIVVDGNSEDNTKKIVKKYSDIKVLDNPERNTAVGRNIGIKNAKAKYIGFVDGDVEVEKNWLKFLVLILLNHKDRIAGVGGATRIPKNSSEFLKALGYMLNTWWGGIGSAQGTNFEDEKEVESIPNCNALYRKKILETFKYDERFKTGQDAELNFRIRKNGYRFIYTPKAIVYHKMRSNLRKWCKRMFEYGEARTKIIKKHPSSFRVQYAIPLAYILSLVLVSPSYFLSKHLFKIFLLFPSLLLISSVIFSFSTLSKHRKLKYTCSIFPTYLGTIISYGLGMLTGIFR